MKFLKELFHIDDFWRGWFGAICITSLTRDWYGKEEYIKLVNENWHDSTYTVPLALAVIGLCIWSSLRDKS